MGFFSKFESRVEDGFEGAANKMFDAPISPVQIAKKAEKQMRREKMVGAGKQYAPTLYTVLVNPDDDRRLFGYYPTLGGETETYLRAKAAEEGLSMDGAPLVRFIVDNELKPGKFDIIAEMVSGPIVAQLREEEMQRYGLVDSAPAAAPVPQQPMPTPVPPVSTPEPRPYDAAPLSPDEYAYAAQQAVANAHPNAAAAAPVSRQDLPYVPPEELDYSIDYGEYTFNSEDFENHEAGYDLNKPAPAPAQAPHMNNDRYVRSADVPDTTVFAAGARGVNPIPDAAAEQARLLNLATGRAFALATSRVLIGRGSKCDIVLDDINASRTHAEVHQESAGVWAVMDLGSTNGTLVNGRRITSAVLNEGDRITIGMTTFLFTTE